MIHSSFFKTAVLLGVFTLLSQLCFAAPTGVFSSDSSLTSSVTRNAQISGVLVRASWSTVEPTAGNFDFSSIDNQLSLIQSTGKQWSLGIVAGPSSPSWLYGAPYNVPPLSIDFRGSTTQVPMFWDANLQSRVTLLAQAIASKYGSDSSLVLVYVPQMSANGIEGHFNGNTNTALTSQGFSEDLWVNAVNGAVKSFSDALPDKSIAIELHYILGSANAGKRIIKNITDNSSLSSHVGIATWWLSGKTTYQPDLLTAFQGFSGAKFGQLIDESSNASAFLNGDYKTAFTQAESLGIKYVEAWSSDVALGTWDTVFADFNAWLSTLHSPPMPPQKVSIEMK